MPYEPFINNTQAVSKWPALAGRVVEVGGVPVSYTEASRVARLLSMSRTSAIAPVLAHARSPLARCDYFAAARPYLAAARQAPKTGRSGAAGRHVTKNAFITALRAGLRRAEEAELRRALGAFREDERYAAAMAREAVAILEREHAAGARTRVRASVEQAVAACHAPRACGLDTACGTGACPFAAAGLGAITAPAGPGKLVRPAGHALAGARFGDAAAVADLLAARPYRVAVQAA